MEVRVIVGCLALNASFEPLTMVPLRRALRLVIDGKAEIVEADRDRMVRSEHLSLPRPAVIRLMKFIHVPRRFRRQVTNTFLFARDRYRCQYCSRSTIELKPRQSLTRDHLVPLSRGGTNEWTNVVTACSPCNTRKANHLPEEIGMHPIVAPVEPHFVHLSWAVRRLTPIQAKYIRTFYGAEVLHQLEDLEHRTRHVVGGGQRAAGGDEHREHATEHLVSKPHGHHRR
jgi:5-methylcytosine-specific restriction endonuclease McrA